jgi:capsular exopolysaccharide synthesis family protein
MEPYRGGSIFSGVLSERDILDHCRNITPQGGTLIVNVSYIHPRQVVAVKLAELFAEEIRAANEENRLKVMNPGLEFTRLTIATIKKELAEKQTEKEAKIIANPRLMELDSAFMPMGDFLQRRATLVGEEKQFKEQERFWKQLEELKAKKLPLTRFRAIAQAGQIPTLNSLIYQREIALTVSKLSYGDKHPDIVAKEKELDETRLKLDQAIQEEVEKFEESYTTQKNNLELARQALAEKQEEIISLMKIREELNNLNREIADRDRTITNMEQAYFTEKLRSNGGLLPSIDFLDRAFLTSTQPVNKNYGSSAIYGLALGSALGLSIIFLLAFFDDRVKSAADIEGFLQVPLVGILPIARRSSSFRKARLVETGEDKPVTEAFRSIYSSMRINELSRKAKVILVTSTSPSEGKSFVSTNLAITYALQGERVLLLDADLRLPVVAKTLQLEGNKGITNFLQGEIALEDAIHYSVATNLDVLPVGPPCVNPTQVLAGRRFYEMVSTLKGIYDRVIVDSPPVGAVSDVLNLLPVVDGILYVVRFNTVKKRFIRSNIFRLRESKVPIFGAVMNHIGMQVVRYYTNSGERSYHRYYTKASKDAVNVVLEE